MEANSPRKVTPEQTELLAKLGEIAGSDLDSFRRPNVMKAVVERMKEACLIVSVDEPSLRVEYCNLGWEELASTTREKTIGSQLTDILEQSYYVEDFCTKLLRTARNRGSLADNQTIGFDSGSSVKTTVIFSPLPASCLPASDGRQLYCLIFANIGSYQSELMRILEDKDVAEYTANAKSLFLGALPTVFSSYVRFKGR